MARRRKRSTRRRRSSARRHMTAKQRKYFGGASKPRRHRRHVRRNAHRSRKGWTGSPGGFIGFGRRASRRRHSRRSNPVMHRRRFHRRRRSNPFSLPKIGGLVSMPSMQQLLGAAIAVSAIPMLNTLIVGNKEKPGLIPLPMLQTGYPNIAAEFVLGSVAAALVKKFASEKAAEVVTLLVLSRAVGRVLFSVSRGRVGFEDIENTLGFYETPQLGYYTQPADSPGSGMAEAVPANTGDIGF